jgi:hypothetical protein
MSKTERQLEYEARFKGVAPVNTTQVADSGSLAYDNRFERLLANMDADMADMAAEMGERLSVLSQIASMHTADFRARLRHHLSTNGKPSDAAALDRAIVEGTKELLAGLKGGG